MGFLRIIIIKWYVTTWKMYIILFYRKNKQARSSRVHKNCVHCLYCRCCLCILSVSFHSNFFIFYFLLYNIFCCCWSWVLFCLTWFNNSRKCVWKSKVAAAVLKVLMLQNGNGRRNGCGISRVTQTQGNGPSGYFEKFAYFNDSSKGKLTFDEKYYKWTIS